MNLTLRRAALGLMALSSALFPLTAAAAETNAGILSAFTVVGVLLALLLGSALLTRVWVGIVNVSLLDVEPIASIERRHPYLPSLRVIVMAVAATLFLGYLSLKTVMTVAPFEGPGGGQRMLIVFSAFIFLSLLVVLRWPRAKEYLFACTLGTVIGIILIGFQRALLSSALQSDPFLMALGVVGVVLAWRFLFGPWAPHIKATVLGTFLFWVGLHLLWSEAPTERTAHLLAILVALIPAVIWCLLFLKYHVERLTLVFLMFFAGMLSTAPILFYDALVRNGIELQFFLFRIVPENFSRSSSAFVTGNIASAAGVRATLLTSLVSFLIVGLIEETSKFWVLKKSGTPFFRCINDVMELGIIVAIGFAFAENVINPTYFVGFIQEYLMDAAQPDWGAFLGNVVGRAVLTNMVHILSTGVFGYFFGLALFAGPYLEDAHNRGKVSLVAFLIGMVLQVPEKVVFRRQMILTGLFAAVVLHGLFNFMVSLPDLLPGNPRTLGALFAQPTDSWLHWVSLILVPSLFYVVGGFWLLSLLFFQGENRKVRGQLILTDTFVTPSMG
ncbi:MAG: PrsW family glutamic-type intramembrane protease [Candidatus Peribacteraceae bacterium]|nr:PrsW family glutamic-type intramembrane protease [Candidatus Peribacteraceae bacterium]